MTPERPYEPQIGPAGKLVLAVIVAFGLWAAFGWLITWTGTIPHSIRSTRFSDGDVYGCPTCRLERLPSDRIGIVRGEDHRSHFRS